MKTINKKRTTLALLLLLQVGSIFGANQSKMLPLEPQLGFIEYTFDCNKICYHRWFRILSPNLSELSHTLRRLLLYFLRDYVVNTQATGVDVPESYQRYLKLLEQNLS